MTGLTTLPLFFGGRRCVLSLLTPGTPQYAAKRIVAFVTGIFVNRFGGRRPSVLAGPRPVPRVRVLHREAVQQRIVVDAREALYDVEVFRRSTKRSLVVEIGRVDNERVPFPMPH